jgi:hypothetical protein
MDKAAEAVHVVQTSTSLLCSMAAYGKEAFVGNMYLWVRGCVADDKGMVEGAKGVCFCAYPCTQICMAWALRCACVPVLLSPHS